MSTRRRTRVAIVGAGLAGLSCAERLQDSGIDDFLILEARPRVGGRVDRIERPGAPHLEAGGEWITGPAPQIVATAKRHSIGLIPEPEPVDGGQLIRLAVGGEAVREPRPFGTAPELAAGIGEAFAQLGELAAAVDPLEPWVTPDARQLDSGTLAAWIREHVPDPLAGAAVAARFADQGGHADEVSLLYQLWTIAAYGGLEGWLEPELRRLDGGTSELARRLAAGYPDRILLGHPVRRIAHASTTHASTGVTITTDGGVVEADAVVMALSPTLAARIDYEPGLPLLRDRLQHRWLQGHGAKFFAVYGRQWWRERGLTGEAIAREPFPVIMDASRADREEGVLLAFVFSGSGQLPEHAGLLDDGPAAERAFVATLERCFGPVAGERVTVYSRRWFGETWSHGCGTGTPPGVLSSVGPALRAPLGRIVWSGAETAPKPHLEGAIMAGNRAAEEVLSLLG